MMLPWAFASAFGPSLFAYLRQITGGYTQGLYLIAGMMTVSLILPILVSPPRSRDPLQVSQPEGVFEMEPLHAEDPTA
jgi:MFS-type transporter involved in bile tolerance (Atg22 family)